MVSANDYFWYVWHMHNNKSTARCWDIYIALCVFIYSKGLFMARPQRVQIQMQMQMQI